MKKFSQTIFIFCGLLMLAAFPVFAQEKSLSKQLNFADFVIEKVDKEKVNLSAPFLLELEGVLTKEGKLDFGTSKFTKSEGDLQIIEIAKRSVKEINELGVFKYLKDFEVEKIKFVLGQNNANIYASVVFEQKTREKAKIAANGLKLLLLTPQPEDKDSEEAKIISSGISVNSTENVVTLNFNYQKSVAQAFIQQALEKRRKQQSVYGINFNEIKLESGKDLFVSSILTLIDELNALSQKGKFDWNSSGKIEIEGLGFSERDNLPAYMGFGTINRQADNLFNKAAEEIAQNLILKISNLGLGDYYSQFIDYTVTIENGGLNIKAEIKNKDRKDANILVSELKKNIDSVSNKSREKFVAEKTEVTSNEEKIFITIKLPRTSLDEIVRSGY